MTKLYRLESCEFVRTKEQKAEGRWELGVLLNEGDLGIIDMNGQKVPDVWDWRHLSSFLITFHEALV